METICETKINNNHLKLPDIPNFFLKKFQKFTISTKFHSKETSKLARLHNLLLQILFLIE